MNLLLNRWLLGFVGLATAGFIAYWYVSITQAEIKALRLSEERYKAVAEQNNVLAQHNKEQYILLLQQREKEQEALVLLQQRVKEKQQQAVEKERSVIEYVYKLPEGFEKQCLNMVVPDDIGRVQQH
jgi:hypothetical protein